MNRLSQLSLLYSTGVVPLLPLRLDSPIQRLRLARSGPYHFLTLPLQFVDSGRMRRVVDGGGGYYFLDSLLRYHHNPGYRHIQDHNSRVFFAQAICGILRAGGW